MRREALSGILAFMVSFPTQVGYTNLSYLELWEGANF